MPFNPKTPVKDLYGEFVKSQPVAMDWSELDIDNYSVYSAQRCDLCGKIVVTDGFENRHSDADSDSECEGYLSENMPMMNSAYPIDLDRLDTDEAARALADLPLCIVEIDRNTVYLALTGGGMDLSAEIAEGYMRLGYLPPTHLRIPRMAGEKLSSCNRWLLAGMRRSITLQIHWLKQDLADLSRTRAYMKGE